MCRPGCTEASLVSRARAVRDGGRFAELKAQARRRQGRHEDGLSANGADKHDGEVHNILAHEDFGGRLGRTRAERLMALVRAENKEGPLFIHVVPDEHQRARFAALITDLLNALAAGGTSIDSAHAEAKRHEEFLVPEERDRRIEARRAKEREKQPPLPPEFAAAARLRDLASAPALPPPEDWSDEVRNLAHEQLPMAARVLRQVAESSGAPAAVRVSTYAELHAILPGSPPSEGNEDDFPEFPSEERARLSAQLGALPLSVIPVRPQSERALRQLVGDTGQLRASSTRHFADSKNDASVFSPRVVQFFVGSYTKPGDIIIDPFAGGGTRAVLAASHGCRYVGLELREDEAERVNARLRELGLDHCARIIVADAASADWLSYVEAGSASLVLTCPPYWSHERYSDDPADLSNASSYPEFLDGLRRTIEALVPALRPGAFAAWVVGRIRDTETKALLDLPGATQRLHEDAGFLSLDRIILDRTDGSPAVRRVGQFERTKQTIRVHDDVVVTQLLGDCAAPGNDLDAGHGDGDG